MRISQEKRHAIFKAIHEPVMTERVIVKRRCSRAKDAGQIKQFNQIDSELFYLDVDIFNRVLAALNVEDKG